MMDDIHIADGIAIKLLLAGIVLAGGAVGALGLTSATTQPAVDGPANAAFPIDNMTAGAGSLQLSLDGKGNDPFPTAFPINKVTAASSIDTVSAAFPIDNVTATVEPRDVRSTARIGASGIGSTNVKTWVVAPDVLPQDMEPYDVLSQDMDPY